MGRLPSIYCYDIYHFNGNWDNEMGYIYPLIQIKSLSLLYAIVQHQAQI
jgi:hypothetical protein